MNILVVGGTGTVGSEVVRSLVARQKSVRVMTRSQEKAAAQPDGVQGVVGELADPSSLPPAFDGIEGVFLLTALSPNETAEGLAGVEAAKAASVKRIVYMTVHRLREAAHIPHFASKIPVVDAIQNSGLEYTLLEPNNFFQNDLWLKDAIVKSGVYPSPTGKVGLSRVDVRDIAEAAANALTTARFGGQAYPLVGPEALTGDQIAAVYGKHLGRDVHYVGDDVDAWAEQAKAMLPEWMVHDLRIMFEHFLEHGLVASDEDLAKVREILGRKPRSFDSFAAELMAA